MAEQEKKSKEKKPQSGYDQVKEWMEAESMRDKIVKSLPIGVAADSWIEAALTTIRMDAGLSRCDAWSLVGAMLTLASLGLRLEGPLGQAYLVARAVKVWDPQTRRKEYSHHEAQVQIGYKGLIDLAWRNPDVQDVEAHLVYEHDDFEFELGTNQHLRHRWDATSTNRGDIIVVYSGLRFKNSYYSFRVYPIADVMELREDILGQNGVRIEKDADGKEYYFRTDSQSGNEYEWKYESARKLPWIGYLPQMIQKTAIRRSANYWRLNPDFERAAAFIDADEAGMSQKLAEVAKLLMPDNVLHGKTFQGPGAAPQSRGEANTLATNRDLTAQMVQAAASRKTETEGDGKQEAGTDAQTPEGGGQGETPAEGASGASGDESGAAVPFEDDPSGMTQEELDELAEMDEKANKQK